MTQGTRHPYSEVGVKAEAKVKIVAGPFTIENFRVITSKISELWVFQNIDLLARLKSNRMLRPKSR